jgi:PEP-CTERM motif
MRNILLATAAMALVGSVASAEASTIYVGWNTTGDSTAVTTLATTGAPGSVTSTTTLDGFLGNTVTGADFSPLDLSSTSLGAATGSTSPIFVYVSETGLAGGTLNLTAGLTENILPAGWSVDEWAYATDGSTPFTTAGTLLASSDFTSIGTTATTTTKLTLPTPFTVTEVYEIIPGGAPATIGTDLSTITVSGSIVPEPSTWAMMVIGFMGLGYAAFRRNLRARAIAV